MNPFYFSGCRGPLFGIYHPPLKRSPGVKGFVVCNPWGQEYLRAHRALRQLAINLSDRGQHVLRFDYEGSGDSAGDSADCDLEVWRGDVECAVDELKDTTGLRQVWLIGLRLGANIGWAVMRNRKDVAGIALWEPLLTADVQALVNAPVISEGLAELDGFPVTAALRAQFAELRLEPCDEERQVWIISSTHREEDFKALSKRLGAQLMHEKSPVPWKEDGTTGISGFPVDLMKNLADRLA